MTDPETGVPQAVRTHAAYCPECGGTTTLSRPIKEVRRD
jgi:hypothetical protein